MKRRLALVLLVAGLLLPLPARADVVVHATARFGATECITLIGHDVAGRTRWLAAYWEDAPTQLAAGVCAETDEHVDPPISCTTTVQGDDVYSRSVTLFAAARITPQSAYIIRLVDSTTGDAAAVDLVSPAPPAGAPLCGAGALDPVPITDGAIVIAP